MAEGCPSIKDLERLASGELPASDADAVRSHVDSCSDCRKQVDECRANAAWFAGARSVLVEVASSSSEEVTRDLSPSPVEAASGVVPASKPPTIPGHEIIRELHRGGQGVVYEAVQQSTKRKVAVKVLLEGRFASETARRRFDREVELVASLRHPNIISVFHSGTTEDGHHYYAMDYVRGQPLHRYVHDRHMALAQALRLFVSVCDAVTHAHQHGIIHRDLKPSNILVDVDGQPKVLDFGLAKLLGGPDSDMVSMSGQVVGTLPYVSPEQARGNPDEVDVRTDVYALGVILYQILTGQYPYPVIGQLGEVLRHIAETAPTPPSKAWKADAGIGAQQRQITRVSRVHCPIDDDVETIVLKALAKERDRRYQSVGDLARDIERYLAGQPIEAKRDSSIYVLRKFIRRNRFSVTAASAAITFVLGAGIIFSVQRVRMQRQQVALDVKEAGVVLAGLAVNPQQALPRFERAAPRIREFTISAAAEHVTSESPQRREIGASGAILVNPVAFWESVDGGPLWKNGEWLQICRMPWKDTSAVIDSAREKAISGTPRQKYVAFCLIGQLQGHPDMVPLCKKAAESEAHPGVVMAACWAAGRLGQPVAPGPSAQILSDEISGLTFVRLPEAGAFRRGSSADDPDRFPDEVPPQQSVAIAAFNLSHAEVAVAGVKAFVADPANRDLFGPFEPDSPADAAIRTAAAKIRGQIEALSKEDASRTPADWMSLAVARRYCQWLSERAKAAGISRAYRLPSEDEWEYACRGGGERRFCFGDSAEYTRFFADCEGTVRVHLAAQHMPNMYGLYDMHGGLWELCGSRYPAELVDREDWKQKELYVKRGGAYYSPAVRCRSAQRNLTDTTSPDQYTGLRIVMELVKP